MSFCVVLYLNIKLFLHFYSCLMSIFEWLSSTTLSSFTSRVCLQTSKHAWACRCTFSSSFPLLVMNMRGIISSLLCLELLFHVCVGFCRKVCVKIFKAKILQSAACVCLHTCWSPVWVVPAELPADDASADAPEIEQCLACWPQSEWDHSGTSQNHHCEKLNQEQTLLPPRPPRLPSRHPHILTLGQNESAALWIRVERSLLWLRLKRSNTTSCGWFFCINVQINESKSVHKMVPTARLQLSQLLTWYEDGDCSLHSSADDVIHSKHPVRFNVMIS